MKLKRNFAVREIHSYNKPIGSAMRPVGKRPRVGFLPHRMAAYLFLAQIVVGCGLPQATLLDKPRKLSRVDASDNPGQPALPLTVVAFGFPEDDTDISGYSIYYKVYYSATSDPDYREDERYFDENTYVGTNNEMQSGNSIPNQRGFLEVGESGKSEFGEYYIGHDEKEKAVYIDFDPGDKGAENPDLRDKPIIGYDYPVTENNKVKILARGFIDPTDRRSNTFRSFVADWEYDSGGGYNDGDLRRGYNVLKYQPGREEKDIENCGTPFAQPTRSMGPYEIRFVVHSYGRIAGSLQPITSKPVIFGDVRYSPVHDANNRNHSSDTGE